MPQDRSAKLDDEVDSYQWVVNNRTLSVARPIVNFLIETLHHARFKDSTRNPFNPYRSLKRSYRRVVREHHPTSEQEGNDLRGFKNFHLDDEQARTKFWSWLCDSVLSHSAGVMKRRCSAAGVKLDSIENT